MPAASSQPPRLADDRKSRRIEPQRLVDDRPRVRQARQRDRRRPPGRDRARPPRPRRDAAPPADARGYRGTRTARRPWSHVPPPASSPIARRGPGPIRRLPASCRTDRAAGPGSARPAVFQERGRHAPSSAGGTAGGRTQRGLGSQRGSRKSSRVGRPVPSAYCCNSARNSGPSAPRSSEKSAFAAISSASSWSRRNRSIGVAVQRGQLIDKPVGGPRHGARRHQASCAAPRPARRRGAAYANPRPWRAACRGRRPERAAGAVAAVRR